MKKIILHFALLVSFYTTIAQENSDFFTIYLVRHAEKVTSDQNNPDPALTSCGQERANSFSSFFQQVDLDKVYSSDYIRTKDTANPTAASKGKTLTLYDPRDLEAVAKILLDQKEDALVVGHSNTTGVLAGLLCNENLEPFDESIYNRIYQVVISKKTARLHLYHTAFSCE